MTRFVYVVDVPEDSGLDGIYSTAAKAVARLREYGPVPKGAIQSVMRGEIVYVLPSDDDQYPQTHACRVVVK